AGCKRREHHLSRAVERECDQERHSRGSGICRRQDQRKDRRGTGRRGSEGRRQMKAAALLLAASLSLFAQKLHPIHWALAADSEKAPPGSSVAFKLTAKLDEGWHLYSLTTPKGGPIPTTAGLADNAAVAGFKLYQPKPERKFDPNFNLDTETFE